jgi:hypothetical protein
MIWKSDCILGFPISAVNFVIYEATLKLLADNKVK